MKTNRTIGIVGTIIAALLLTVVILHAQSSTEEPTAEATSVPSSFSDNRINGDIFLGGLALYCEDEMGSTAGNTFQNGALTVWGPEGQEYIRLTASQLRGDEEIPQPPMMMPDATEEPMATVEPSSTEEATLASPVLLAQAETVNGTIWLFRVGEDAFSLQGTDNTGKFYTYTWIGCALGILSTDTPAMIPMTGTPVPMPEMTGEATAEATASS